MNLNEKNYDEATEWLARLRASDVSNADHEKFALWLIEDSANKPAFDAMLRIWEDLGVVSQLEPADFIQVKVNSPAATVQAASWLYAPYALVATLVLTLAVLFIFQYTGTGYSSPIGQIRVVTLEDGSQVQLNSNSHISVRYSDTRRTVQLSLGEAFFQVKKDVNRPFIVQSKGSTIKALGTAFGVWNADQETRVVVTEGLVNVSNGTQVLELGANQQANIFGKFIEAKEVDARSLTAWRDGRLEYDGVAFAQLISDLNRYLPRRVVLGLHDKELREHRVSGIIEIADQDTMLLALQKSLIIPINFTFSSDNQIVITRTN